MNKFPAVAVSRGLLAPANFLIDVMRGAPSLKKKNIEKIIKNNYQCDVNLIAEAPSFHIITRK